MASLVESVIETTVFIKAEKWRPSLKVHGRAGLEGSHAKQREKVSATWWANRAVSINWLWRKKEICGADSNRIRAEISPLSPQNGCRLKRAWRENPQVSLSCELRISRKAYQNRFHIVLVEIKHSNIQSLSWRQNLIAAPPRCHLPTQNPPVAPPPATPQHSLRKCPWTGPKLQVQSTHPRLGHFWPLHPSPGNSLHQPIFTWQRAF